jgi:hypothetical protein
MLFFAEAAKSVSPGSLVDRRARVAMCVNVTRISPRRAGADSGGSSAARDELEQREGEPGADEEKAGRHPQQ